MFSFALLWKILWICWERKIPSSGVPRAVSQQKSLSRKGLLWAVCTKCCLHQATFSGLQDRAVGQATGVPCGPDSNLFPQHNAWLLWSRVLKSTRAWEEKALQKHGTISQLLLPFLLHSQGTHQPGWPSFPLAPLNKPPGKKAHSSTEGTWSELIPPSLQADFLTLLYSVSASDHYSTATMSVLF